MIRRLFSLLSPQTASGAKMERRARPSLETLEDRTTPTVTIANVGGVLTVRGDVNPASPPLPNLPIASTDTVTITQTATAGSFTVAATTSVGVVVGAGVYTGITSIDIDLGTSVGGAAQAVAIFSDGSAVVGAFGGNVSIKDSNSGGALTVAMGNAGNATDNINLTGPMNINHSTGGGPLIVVGGAAGGTRTTLGNVTTTSGPVGAVGNVVVINDTTMGFLSVNNSTGTGNFLVLGGGTILAGFLSYTGGVGVDTVVVDQTTVGGNFGVNMGGGAGANVLAVETAAAGATTITGNLFYIGASTTADIMFLGTVAGSTTAITGFVTYNATGNADTVVIGTGAGAAVNIGSFLSIVGNTTVTVVIGGAGTATVGQNFAVVGGPAVDTIVLDKFTVGGTTSIDTATGADIIVLTSTAASTYNGALSVNAGGATDVSADVIVISTGAGFATFRSTSTFSAGGGADVLTALGKGIFTGGAPIINADIETVTV